MVAIKKIVLDVGSIEDIINEIRILKSLKSPHVVEYYDAYIKSGFVWVRLHCNFAKSFS